MYSYRLKHICYLYNFFQNSSGIIDTIIIWLTRSLQEISSQVTYLILDTDKLIEIDSSMKQLIKDGKISVETIESLYNQLGVTCEK